MKSQIIRRSIFPLIFLFSALVPLPASVGADAVWRSGNPPKVVKAIIDDQRRLVVEFSAPDGMSHLNGKPEDRPKAGGSIVMDKDPINAKPVSESSYGPLMFCNNIGKCMGKWTLPLYPEAPTYTYTSSPLSEKEFPAGTYYLQVNVLNEDPFPSTRQEEFSNIEMVVLGSIAIAPSHIVPLLIPVQLPVSNGTPLCIGSRIYLSIFNLYVKSANASIANINAKLIKMSDFPPPVEKAYQAALKQSANQKALLEKVSALGMSACSATPSAQVKSRGFTSLPVPDSNGTAACKKNRDHLIYVNQEVLKVANNYRTTQKSQTARTKQLDTRMKQLNADLAKTWPLVFKTCAQL